MYYHEVVLNILAYWYTAAHVEVCLLERRDGGFFAVVMWFSRYRQFYYPTKENGKQ